MGMELYLDDEDRGTREEFHRAYLDKKTADNIKTILLMAQGFTYTEIEQIWLLDKRPLNRYNRLYRNEGIDG
ncbi:hypothetical protein Holit_03294 [Hollandina sp. SP2]